jgi:hypothetical protein
MPGQPRSGLRILPRGLNQDPRLNRNSGLRLRLVLSRNRTTQTSHALRRSSTCSRNLGLSPSSARSRSSVLRNRKCALLRNPGPKRNLVPASRMVRSARVKTTILTTKARRKSLGLLFLDYV